jgi:hypothetical protein
MPSPLESWHSWLNHMEWADARTLEALRASGGQPEEAMETLAHVLGAEAVWLSRIRGILPDVAVWPELSLDSCEGLLEECPTGFRAVLDEGGLDLD